MSQILGFREFEKFFGEDSIFAEDDWFKEGPMCLKIMATFGFVEGHRNNTLTEIGISTSKIKVSSKTKKWYHPGRSGLLSLDSLDGPELAYFGEIHPSIIKKLDLRTDNVLGFEIFLDNIPESRKKIREAKPQYIFSDYQKVVRDFAFVIDEKYSSGEIVNLVMKIDKELIKNVKIFDVYQGDNITSGKKSIAFNVTLEPKDKTLSEKDIDQISKKIISKVQETTGATLRS